MAPDMHSRIITSYLNRCHGDGRQTYVTCLVIAALVLLSNICLGDGGFVFRWNKEMDINEPAQKAIILYDQGREDLVLQVKYEGPAEEFGWLVPVPGRPEVRLGSMDCFYELSLLTQKEGPMFHEIYDSLGGRGGFGGAPVRVVEIKTVGAYEVAVLQTGDAGKLTEWLAANGFVIPTDKQAVIDPYIQKHWYFVALKIDLKQSDLTFAGADKRAAMRRKPIVQSTRNDLAGGELSPLIISFDSKQCVFPLAISALNGKPSEVSLYVLSAKPLVSRLLFDKGAADFGRRQAEWMRLATNWPKPPANRRYPNWYDDPRDPEPDLKSLFHVVLNVSWHLPQDVNWDPPAIFLNVSNKTLRSCARALPRLKGKSWWLAKQVQTLAPAEMRDLEFEPGVALMAAELSTTNGSSAATCLMRLREDAIPVALAACESQDSRERQLASETLRGFNWRLFPYAGFAQRLLPLLTNSDASVRLAAISVLSEISDKSLIPVFKKMVREDGPAASAAIHLIPRSTFSRQDLVHCLSSTNADVVLTAVIWLAPDLTTEETGLLMTNSQPLARLMALEQLYRVGDRKAIERIVSLLNDPNEGVRWAARSDMRRLTGQNLGSAPTAYETWWARNKDALMPQPSADPHFERQVQ